MEEEEMLEQTSETENTETFTAEEEMEGTEQTNTDSTEVEEKQEVRKSLRELLKENEDYQEEFNSMLTKRLNRRDREEKRNLAKYQDTENVLRSTLNLNEDDDVNTKLREFYENEGMKLPDKVVPDYDKEDAKYLAEKYADEIIDEGYESMEEEANRLANKGGHNLENLTDREKVIFDKLATTLKYEKNKKGLLSIGADAKILKDDDFIEFQKQFAFTTPIEKIYSLYTKQNNQNKTVIENPGSMKNNDDSRYKDYYTDEEISKLSEEQLDNPRIWEAVRKSMAKNYHN